MLTMEIISPKPYQVLQRGVPAKITVKAESAPISGAVTLSGGGRNTAVGGLTFSSEGGGLYSAYAELPAGGWYTLSVRLASSDGERTAEIGPVGVGEVFVIAGQSHATNSNNHQFSVKEPEGRITVYEPELGAWRIAHDPQPCYDSSDYNARFGSLWPCTFDNLYQKIGVPVGMTNAAYGATALFQWMPGGDNFAHLVTCCRAAENFRAILWQQGESDVMWHTETDAYVDGMLTLKSALDAELGTSTKWLIAKSTIHPSVYDDKEHEGKIRRAYEILLAPRGLLSRPRHRHGERRYARQGRGERAHDGVGPAYGG